MSDSHPTSLRLPAEWEHNCSVLLAWPHEDTDWSYMISDVRKCYNELAHAIAPYARLIVVAPDTTDARDALSDITPDRALFVDMPTNDTWTRDYGPLTVECADGTMNALDFCFNGWGLKFASCFDNLVTSRLAERKIITGPTVNCRDFVLEGGGIESDGKGTLLTTSRRQLSPNRNATLSRGQIEAQLKGRFGASRVLWLDHGYLAGDDTDSHIDTLARFAPNDSIVFTGCSDPADEHFAELEMMKREIQESRTAEGLPYNLFELPLPDAIYDDDSQRLPATYANFLALPSVVLVPTYGQPRKDELACRIISVAFERPTVAVDCRALICQHGSLHCATMQIPNNILVRI